MKRKFWRISGQDPDKYIPGKCEVVFNPAWFSSRRICLPTLAGALKYGRISVMAFEKPLLVGDIDLLVSDTGAFLCAHLWLKLD